MKDIQHQLNANHPSMQPTRDFSVSDMPVPVLQATPELVREACSDESMEDAMEQAQVLIGDTHHQHRIFPTMLTILSAKFGVPIPDLLMATADYLDSVEFQIVYEHYNFDE
ncbi:TPA: hypothetical protein QDZ84_002864 [Shewanella algae]|uniref:hypothetical protein n=1 Tax=Shewanella algae TaxID=38313 RepID=UPI001AAFE4CD|nr:hypothetical protein [Shewanella algae]MBO2580250.1 hypothetical protein [Shewanella algae]HDS1207837.1 hypothetical protein [Shewanella algae]